MNIDQKTSSMLYGNTPKHGKGDHLVMAKQHSICSVSYFGSQNMKFHFTGELVQHA
jgi:hypothetical protein